MNEISECSVCHSKLVASPTKRTVSKAYDRHRTVVSVKTRAFNVFLVVGDCVLVGLQVCETCIVNFVVLDDSFTTCSFDC